MNDRGNRADTEARVFAATRESIKLDSEGKPLRAVALLTGLLAEFPQEPGIHIYLAWYLRRSGEYDEATEHGRRAIQLAPRSSYASIVLFQTLWDAGKRSEAIEEIRRFLPVRRSEHRTPHYEEILRRWDAGDQDAADHVKVKVQDL